MYTHLSTLVALLAFGSTFHPGIVCANDKTVVQQIQQTLDDYIAQRQQAESISGVSLHVELGDPGPIIEAFSGNFGRNSDPIDGYTLFQIGSNTKHFEAALLLKLEAAGMLDINETVGDWLPQYPAWASVTIRQLLNMTSPIPNYSETVGIGALEAADIHHQFTNEQLISAAYPSETNPLPTPKGWFYSNTNNILAALIIEKASGLPFKRALETMLIAPVGLRDTFYADGPYPGEVLDRLPQGIYANAACLGYQPVPCTRSTLAPLIGEDMRTQNLSWGGAAGAIISNPRDLARWIRTLFGGRYLPRQQLDEMMMLVSQKTGKSITQTGPGDKAGFGLDLAQMYNADAGGVLWLYEGETLGYRVIFAYWPQYNLVMTVATNSQPPEGEDQLGSFVLGRVFAILKGANLLPTIN